MLGVVSLLLLGAGCDAAPPDPRPRAVEHVLSPDWREGMTWSLEVHGSVAKYKWTASFWGISHFVVESVDDHRATVTGRFHPIVFRSVQDPACSSRLEFERRPFRLVRVELVDDGGAHVLTPESPERRFGISPCLPPVPRHPHAAAGPTPETRRPQRVVLDDGEVVFTTRLKREADGGSGSPGVTRWRAGMPWWSKHETLDFDGRSLFGMHPTGRLDGPYHRDPFIVERARLIALDGVPIRPANWNVAAPGSRFRWYSHWPDDPSWLPPEGLFVSQAP